MIRPFLLACCLSTATPAAAQVVGDPDVIRLLMTEFGLLVDADTDASGDPRLNSRIDGTSFGVYFYDCTDGRDCQAIQFSAGFDLNDPMALDKVNHWNRDRRFGKVYLDDEGDPYIEMDINVDYDGIGRKNFSDSLDIWRRTLSGFRDYIDW